MRFLSWLEKLKQFIKIEFNAPLIDNRKIIFVKDSFKNGSENIQLNKQPILLDKREPIAYLNVAAINDKQKEQLKLILREYVNEGNKLLQIDAANLLDKLYVYNKENTDRQILEFFQGIIPEKDLETLQASLYLRSVFKKRENVQKLKKDIRNAFGARGNNIANLCTAGYFEEFLIPLYNATKEEKGKFSELYELIVDKAVLAIFVHHNMGADEVINQIVEKIETAKRYGFSFIHIHGIGEANVTKIKECIKEKKEFFKFFERKVFEKANILIIELILK